MHNCLQFVDAAHDNWDIHFTITGHESACHITSLLYTVFSSSFPLPFTQLCAKWLLMRPLFWLPSFAPCGPDSCPCSLGKVYKVHAVQSRTRALQRCGCRLDPMQTTKKLFSLLFDRCVHKNGTQPAQLSVSSAAQRHGTSDNGILCSRSTNAFKIVTQVLPAPSHVAHT